MNVTANADFESNNYSTRVNYDGTVTITRFKNMVPNDLVLPDGVTTLCFSSITGANLQTVTVPAGVTEIEKGAISSNVDLTLIMEKGSYAETYA